MDRARNENFLVKKSWFNFEHFRIAEAESIKICNYLVYSISLSKLDRNEQLHFRAKNSLPFDIFVTTSDCVYSAGFVSVYEKINQIRVETWPTATCGTRFSTEISDILHLSQMTQNAIEHFSEHFYPIEEVKVILFHQKWGVAIFRGKRRRCRCRACT